ncbi:SH3 domain-containing protein [Salipaludibacillus sp. HK11]|uniref:SH3 domain-containing protein n=1 Tax=Salipaludibacillus sp. HK11 TaxID=3394320 RepID=UPI0039FD530F
MKKGILWFLTIILVTSVLFETTGSSLKSTYADAVDKGEITASSLNIRSQPATNASIIGGYTRGTKVDLHEKTGNWFKVRHNNRWGYIHGDHVKVTSSSTSSGSSSLIGSGEVTATNLNVRASATTSSSIISSIRKGTKVDLLEKSGSWYKIKVGSRTGYIHGNYVKVTNTSSGSGSSGGTDSSSTIGNGEVTASNLNVRASASTNSSIISSLRKGTKVDLLEKSGNWYEIKVGSRTGYIHGSYVNVTNASSGSGSSGGTDASSTVGSGEITASNLNVRASASTNSSIISSLRKGTKVDLLEKSGNWYKVKVGSRTGYIHGNYVKVTEASSGSGSSGGTDSSSSVIETGEVTASNLNVRASASTSSSIVSSLRRGTKVDIYEKSGNWLKIKVGSGWGYIHGSYVAAATSNSNGSGSGSLNGKTIFLDPGHGGRDPGAVNGSTYEKTIVLNLSNKVKQALEREGAKVSMSRTNDSYIAFGTRANLANQANADLFISIHANSFTSSAASGVEVLYSETKYPTESRKLAQQLQTAIASGMNMRDRGIVRRNLQVLTGPNMPAVLIEPGFMSNPSDLDKLLNQQDKLAGEIVRGIKAYYQ